MADCSDVQDERWVNLFIGRFIIDRPLHCLGLGAERHLRLDSLAVNLSKLVLISIHHVDEALQGLKEVKVRLGWLELHKG